MAWTPCSNGLVLKILYREGMVRKGCMDVSLASTALYGPLGRDNNHEDGGYTLFLSRHSNSTTLRAYVDVRIAVKGSPWSSRWVKHGSAYFAMSQTWIRGFQFGPKHGSADCKIDEQWIRGFLFGLHMDPRIHVEFKMDPRIQNCPRDPIAPPKTREIRTPLIRGF